MSRTADAVIGHLPTLSATIEQRIFVTFRADPDAVRPLVPDRYELRLTEGMSIGGVCLLRLRHLRPSGLPRWSGFSSDNAAHRISIVDHNGEPAIWAPRRDTNSRMSAAVGSAMFPDAPGRAIFDRASQFSIRCTDGIGDTIASVDASIGGSLPGGSLFSSVDDVCDYYRAARRGYSPANGTDLTTTLDIDGWKVTALEVADAHSSMFDPLVAVGAAVLDHAVLMRNLNSTWTFGHR